jgi:purine-nucleoside phosphorylase
MKQTAVEWLVEELNQKIDFIPMEKWDMIRNIVQQAKEIEKEQHKVTAEDFYYGSYSYKKFNEYYKENYNK